MTTDPRQQIVAIGAELYRRRYVVAAEGNLSIKIADNRFVATPAGACKGWLRVVDLVEVDRDGRSRGTASRATSEWRLHREIYTRCPSARAVCHAHPPFATACATAGRALASGVLQECMLSLGEVPLARPAAAGSEQVAESVREYLPEARAILLANHGAVAWGRDLVEAYFRLEYLERLAEVTLLGELAGGARPLPAELCRPPDSHSGPDLS
ncbi:MAG: class II aldolase/adducin family protein [Candidatus Krumholzibacteria bacterium]|nr:class II aldolase/adducin family protein [Candidatus Krumholzibacteria bacterium]